jgi:hypothetical protein
MTAYFRIWIQADLGYLMAFLQRSVLKKLTVSKRAYLNMWKVNETVTSKDLGNLVYFSKIFNFYYVLEVHCDIYKSAYNIS